MSESFELSTMISMILIVFTMWLIWSGTNSRITDLENQARQLQNRITKIEREPNDTVR